MIHPATSPAPRRRRPRPAPPAIPRRVRLLEGDDFTCVLLGSLGFSTKFIMTHTELSPGQVSYRLRLGQVRRMDYRNGESAVAQGVLGRARRLALPVVTEQLRQVLEKT